MSATPQFDPADFRKSSRSEPNKNCVYVATDATYAEIRDGKTAFGTAADGRLRLPAPAFTALLATVEHQRS